MGFDLIHADARGATLHCRECGKTVEIMDCAPGNDRTAIAKAWREVVGCECPVGEGGTAAIIPGMMVFRISDGRQVQVSEVQPQAQQIRVLDNRDGLSNWMDVRKFSKRPQGEALKKYMDRLKAGIVE